MAVRTLTESAANAAKGHLAYTQAALHNDVAAVLDAIRTYLTGDRLFSGNPALAIDTNFDVQAAGACVVSIDGTLVSIAATTSCDTGTSATLAADTWGVMLVTASATDTLAGTWATASGAGYATEALAIAALPDAPANHAPVGYVTVLTASGATWTAGTDALQGGTGGNPSDDTNYYNVVDPASTISSATVDTIAFSATGTP